MEIVQEKKKSFKCDLCDYSAFKLAKVKRHIECIHGKIKQHQYTICQKCFSRKSTLRNQIEVVHKNG